MTLTTYLIDINSISFNQSYNYDSNLIEKLANLLLEQNGTTQPIVVKKIGLDQYELISGEIVLLAAICANKIDSFFEMIRVYIEDNISLTTEKDLIAEIAKTAKNKTAKEEKTAKIKEKKEELNSEKSKIATDWLLVNDEYLAASDWYSLNLKEKEIRTNNPTIKTEIKPIQEEKSLLEQKAECLKTLAKIEKELEARAKFLDNK